MERHFWNIEKPSDERRERMNEQMHLFFFKKIQILLDWEELTSKSLSVKKSILKTFFWHSLPDAITEHPPHLMVWGIFSWPTLWPLVPIENCLSTGAYYFQQDKSPQITSNWNMTVTRSEFKRAPLGCVGTVELHHRWKLQQDDEKSAATAWCHHDNVDPNLW